MVALTHASTWTHALKVCSHRRLNKLGAGGLDLNWFGCGFEAKRLGLIDSCKKKTILDYRRISRFFS